MSTKLTDSEGRIASVDAFAAIVVNVMNALNIPLDRLVDPTKTRTPNGFPEALAHALNDVELSDAGPADWNASKVSKRYKKWQVEGSLFPAIERALSSERCEQSEPSMKPSDRGEHSKHHDLDEPEDISFSAEDLSLDLSLCSEPSEQNGLTDITDAMKAAIKALAKEVFVEMMISVPNVRTVTHEMADDLPPEPLKLSGTGKGGRRQTREYGKLSATLDFVLFEHFRSECSERKLSAGRLLDAILWDRYGRPELSYQRADAQERARARPKRSS
jgi:hypothetical protein